MSDYYVDLGYTGTGHAGTDHDPFSFEDFRASTGANTGSDHYYVRGQIDASSYPYYWVIGNARNR